MNAKLIIFMLLAATAMATAQTRARTIEPFNLSDVTLLDGKFKDNMNRTCTYLLFLNNNRLLYSFRRNYQQSTQGAQPLGGWEAPDHGLRGHFMGHLLSALAQAYAVTDDNRYKAKADSLVTALAALQNTDASAGYSAGFLAAFTESKVDSLIAHKCSWAPLYCMHKIFAGMIDCHLLLGDATALEVATKMGDWTYQKLRTQSTSQLEAIWQDMCWNMGEYGGYNESCANLYEITKNANHIAAAKFFNHAAVFTPCQNNQDALNGKHANTQIPKFIGCMRIFETTGEQNYYTMAKNFWSMVTSTHCYITGGTSISEQFRAPNAIAGQLADNTCESCCAHNMLKLARLCFFHDPQPVYMDYYERALFNQILGSQNPSSARGYMTYFQPMRAGGMKTYGNDESFTCCDGTGVENHTKYVESIYFHHGDTLYVNLFIPSQLTWTEKNITVKMETKYPDNDTVHLAVSGYGAANMPLKIRAPYWLRRTMEIWVNGSLQSVVNKPSTYVSIPAVTGALTLVMPQTIRFERSPDNASVGGVLYGTQVMTGQYGTNNLSAIPSLDASTVQKTTAAELACTGTASTGAVTMLPFSRTHGQRYTVYWNLSNVPRDTFIVTKTVAAQDAQRYAHKPAPAPGMSVKNGMVVVNWTVPAEGEQTVTVRLFNAQGRMKTEWMQLPLHNGHNARLRPASGVLSAGIYLCTVTVGRERYNSTVLCGK
jgi:DUF1680 family protein